MREDDAAATVFFLNFMPTKVFALLRLVSSILLGIKCGHQFCYDCLADHKEVMEKDNSAHAPTCPWHPNNLKDEGPVSVDQDDEDEDDDADV